MQFLLEYGIKNINNIELTMSATMPRNFAKFILFAAVVTMAAVISTPRTRADIFSLLLKSVEKATVIEARHAGIQMAAGTRRVVAVSMTEMGGLELVAMAGGSTVSAVAVSHTDDFVRTLSSIKDLLLVPVDVVTKHPGVMADVLRARNGGTEVVDKAGKTASLHLAKRAGIDQLVVSYGERVTLSPEAWGRRGFLQQSLMQDLAGRLKVVVLVDRTDVVQRQAYIKRFGKNVAFIDSEDALRKELKGFQKQFVVVVGHVEGENFVLVDAKNRILINEPIASIHRRIDEAQSVSLALGCNVACAVPGSGPTAVIDAITVAERLGEAAHVDTPLDFLSALAEKIGPMHVETDLFGRLRAVSADNVRTSDRVVQGAGLSMRLLLPTAFSPPITISALLSMGLASIASAVVLCLIMGWGGMLMLGIGPRKAWRQIKDLRAGAAGRLEESDLPIPLWEMIVLVVVGPIIMLLCAVVTISVVTINFLLALLSLVLVPFFLGRASCLLLANTDMIIGAGFLGESAKRRIGATALLAGGSFSSLSLIDHVVPDRNNFTAAAAVIVGLLSSWAILMRFPWLKNFWPILLGLGFGLLALPFLMIQLLKKMTRRFPGKRRALA